MGFVDLTSCIWLYEIPPAHLASFRPLSLALSFMEYFVVFSNLLYACWKAPDQANTIYQDPLAYEMPSVMSFHRDWSLLIKAGILRHVLNAWENPRVHRHAVCKRHTTWPMTPRLFCVMFACCPCAWVGFLQLLQFPQQHHKHAIVSG